MGSLWDHIPKKSSRNIFEVVPKPKLTEEQKARARNSNGGMRRAEKLSPERRREIALKASQAALLKRTEEA